jgi:hypothetical protein
MKTLQEQFNLIKEGKGAKDVFLKTAKAQFPDMIRNASTFEEATSILKQRSVISENWGVVCKPTINTDPNWFKIFEESVHDAKIEEKKPTKEVVDLETKGYDYKTKENTDNLFGAEFLKGYYAEIKDPKNEEKTVEQIKSIVAKNLAKDPLYYVKNSAFGVKGIGYTKEAPGLGESKPLKGKHKSSGYGDLPKKKLNESIVTEKMDLNSFEKALEKTKEAYERNIGKNDEEYWSRKMVDLLDIYEKEMGEVHPLTKMLGMSKSINETFKVDKTYTHFALNKADNKIVTGWDYKDTDPEDIKMYTKEDLKDMDLKPSEYIIASVSSLKKKGIDPFDWKSWKQVGETIEKKPKSTIHTSTKTALLKSTKLKNSIKEVIKAFK